MNALFKPEGWLCDNPENAAAFSSLVSLQEACTQGRILEARALICDSAHNLIVDCGCIRGIIPKNECAIGIEDGSTREIAIISRVNKPVCFRITEFRKGNDNNTYALLSRRVVQQQCIETYINRLTAGDIIDARVTHLEPFGCFVDVGCGVASLIPIDAISVSRISHPGDRFRNGQDIRAVVKSVDSYGRISLSHKELWGTWEENAALFHSGETVAGIVRSVEEYGVFVELTPNLAGLAEPREGVRPGQHTSVYIKSLIREKMKVKLIIVDSFDAQYAVTTPPYFISGNHISRWQYSPDGCGKIIETRFE
ncbi:S1 RNA-binding domain-containing protein [Hydrogenoanaerobacterium sp.]|uniref:S1 RNA-binding domain-containing protein n=1 Tax=Hydrogenoanaerobacterium sp. TaxID=2953763 RepID=UPI0028975CFC|nr:S1 RNA-binding domain-containing protein [Hydrogenoanaerobacterium sp.]